MPRYIDVERFCKENPNFDSAVYVALSKAPTIEVNSVRHGTWKLEKIVYDQDLFCCSECGRHELVYNKYSRDMAERYPYCHCGAKMDGGNVHLQDSNKICPTNGAPCNECVPGAYCAKTDGGAKE